MGIQLHTTRDILVVTGVKLAIMRDRGVKVGNKCICDTGNQCGLAAVRVAIHKGMLVLHQSIVHMLHSMRIAGVVVTQRLFMVVALSQQ